MSPVQASTSFQRVAILNRGEPAVRFLRALREYNLERGTQLRAIAFYTDPDDDAPFVREADEAVLLGPALRASASGTMVSAYCDHDHVVQLLQDAACDAVWPGWGFVAEDAAFVKRLEDVGITFLGPSAASMRMLGDKIEAKLLADEAKVPMGPWCQLTGDETPSELKKKAKKVGYPLMVKASPGGGGRGIRKVDDPNELASAVIAVQNEVEKSFGAGGLLMEACVMGGRHVEIQLVVAADGKATAVGVRDCSIQRRNQKVVEEAPATILPDEIVQTLCSASANLAESAGYRGAATAEFLYAPASGDCTFLEINSRLQVEHTVTELVRGVDIVQAQIDIARGLPWLDGPLPSRRGHAIEVRVNAEDAEQGFQPSPGLVRVFRPPLGPGVRVDSGIDEGMRIAPEFDSMIAKVMAWAPTRERARARLIRALQELELVVEDGATNKAFLLELLEHPRYIDMSADTRWLDTAMEKGEIGAPRHEFEALISGAVLEYRREHAARLARFFTEVEYGIPQHLPEPSGMKIDLRLRGASHAVWVHQLGPNRYLAGPEGHLHPIQFDPTTEHVAVMRMGDAARKIVFAYGTTTLFVEVDGTSHRIERSSGGVVRAPSPAMVVNVAVAEGDIVEVGDLLCTVEAMKMEMAIRAPDAGIVETVLCRANEQASAGQALVIVSSDQETTDTTPTAQYPDPGPGPFDLLFDDGKPVPQRLDDLTPREADRIVDAVVDTLLSPMLGFDGDPAGLQRIEQLLSAEAALGEVKHPERWERLTDIPGTFASVGALFDRNTIVSGAGDAEMAVDQAFFAYCRRYLSAEEGALPALVPRLTSAFAWYGESNLEPSEDLRNALWRLAVANTFMARRHRLCTMSMRALIRLGAEGMASAEREQLQQDLQTVAQVAHPRHVYVADTARQAEYELFETGHHGSPTTGLASLLAATQERSHKSLGACLARLYPGTAMRMDSTATSGDVTHAEFTLLEAPPRRLRVASGPLDDALTALTRPRRSGVDPELLEVFLTSSTTADEVHTALLTTGRVLDSRPTITFNWLEGGRVRHRTYHSQLGRWQHNERLDNIHPCTASRVGLDRLQEFEIEHIAGQDTVHAFRAVARTNPRDERLIVYGDVSIDDEPGARIDGDTAQKAFETVYFQALQLLRDAQSRQNPRRRYLWNRLIFHFHPVVKMSQSFLQGPASWLRNHTRGLGIEKVKIVAQVETGLGQTMPLEFTFSQPAGQRLEMTMATPSEAPLKPATRYEMKVVRARRLNYIYPYEVVRMLEGQQAATTQATTAFSTGHFVEYDLNEQGDALVPVERDRGENKSGIVTGLMTHTTERYPEGIERVWLASDPTTAIGALAEPECRRVIAAIDLADARGIPVEWIPISAGAKIAMDSGTENLDWTARTLARIVSFTQAGGEINILVSGVNVGAQSYWNAEATMLMHTRGMLIMTRQGSMVLTGKRALEFSGGVAAEDERGIGGFERIMGPNGQAQYDAIGIGDAYRIMSEYYRYTYRRPDEKMPRMIPTRDPSDRSVMDFPYRPVSDETFGTIGEIFHEDTNPGRKKPFAIREVMGAVIDQDGGHLERFRSMRYAENSVVWESCMGGHPICMIGIESRPRPRRGRIPMDGPNIWTGGTLFPSSSKKVARALNAASGNRPVVVLANLSGFDGSPESLRKLQLEYGAEIGRAVVNFDGRIVFVVIGRYHGGAYVVFSKSLNPGLRAMALEGTYASVIGGAPAAAVVFPREVRRRSQNDARVVEARTQLANATPTERPRLEEALGKLQADILLEKRGEVAREFDGIHTVQRAVDVGSLDRVVAPEHLRSSIIEELDAYREVREGV
jgi:acetyl/propionyl-CoA carboxylase alpha subunit/acetyl-CoA carboxylase carboxyltransferase component